MGQDWELNWKAVCEGHRMMICAFFFLQEEVLCNGCGLVESGGEARGCGVWGNHTKTERNMGQGDVQVTVVISVWGDKQISFYPR